MCWWNPRLRRDFPLLCFWAQWDCTGTNVTKMTSPTSPSARIGNPCLVHCEKMRFTVPKFKKHSFVATGPIGSIHWKLVRLRVPYPFHGTHESLICSSLRQFHRSHDLMSSEASSTSVVFFATDGFPIPFFWGSRLVTLWECHPATENRQHLLVIKYVYQLPCDLGLGNPPFLFVFWCRMGVLVASRTGTRATLILQAWHGVRVGVWVLGWALKLEWSACHASRHSVERLAFPGVADMPSI